MKIGPYELLEALGKGGMATVHRAFHEETGQIVALKVMTSELVRDPILIQRFENEWLATKRLHHPHIVSALDFGTQDGQPFLIMEYVEGESLGARVRRGPVPAPTAVRIALQVADALEVAHKAKLIHRDVKPDNILLTTESEAKLTDLGLVKDLDGEVITRSGAWLGTLAYMAPEQFGEARDVDARCDVYGLAATLYHALCGSPPFLDQGGLTVLGKKLKSEFIPLLRKAPGLPIRLVSIIHQSLDANPNRRPETCGELGALLASAMPEALSRDSATNPEETPPEMRKALRYPSELLANCQALQGENRQWAAKVVDISISGICLQIERRYEPSTILRVVVRGKDEDKVGGTYLASVRWVREASPRKWTVGCTFSRPLVESEFNSLIGNHPPTIYKP